MSRNNLLSTIQEYKINSRFDEAIDLIKQQLHYSPYYYDFHYEIAGIYLIKNDFGEARYHFERCQAIDNQKAAAGILLNFLETKGDYQVSNKSISVLFDYYADTFDQELLIDLEYKTPELIANTLKAKYSGRTFKNMFDAGCGTGLCGERCKSLAENIYGVDLSSNMLKLAKQKQIYQELIIGDITHELGRYKTEFDLITAADVFVYIQELKYFFEVATQSLSIDGVLAFSIVSAGQEDNSGRFSHSQEYIQDLCDNYGFQIITDEEENIRKNYDEWIKGRIYLLSKTAI